MTGTLILAAPRSGTASEQLTLNGIGVGIVYEFRNVTLAEMERVSMPDESASIAARITGLRRANVQHSQTPTAQDRPIERLLIIPGKGIGRIEGWDRVARNQLLLASTNVVMASVFAMIKVTARA